MAFATIHTSYGLRRLAQAEATGTQIQLTHMAVGDGGGNDVIPAAGQTQLVRERFRATINRVFQSADDPLRFTAELIIPASVGGFTLREIGVYDSDGSLFAVGNLPATYKPNDSEGAYADTAVKLDFMVANASTITLQIDPNVIVVTRQWVSNNVTAAFLLPGGTKDQVLAKRSNADGDTHWIDPTQANVVVDTVEEKQTLAAGQTVIDLTVTITYGLAVYLEGVRLNRGTGADEWQPDATVPTRLTLGKTYPAGTAFLGVNNEPAGSAPSPLERSKNLSDVESKERSRENLEIFSKAETTTLARQQAPAGLVGMFARSTAPAGWLRANGAAVSRSAYADLFAAIGTAFGAGDGVNTFNLPDLRGEFLRGWDDGRGVDASRQLFSSQGQAIQAHSHRSTATAFLVIDPSSVSGGEQVQGGVNNAVKRSATTAETGGTETRPRNVAFLACIKF